MSIEKHACEKTFCHSNYVSEINILYGFIEMKMSGVSSHDSALCNAARCNGSGITWAKMDLLMCRWRWGINSTNIGLWDNVDVDNKGVSETIPQWTCNNKATEMKQLRDGSEIIKPYIRDYGNIVTLLLRNIRLQITHRRLCNHRRHERVMFYGLVHYVTGRSCIL